MLKWNNMNTCRAAVLIKENAFKLCLNVFGHMYAPKSIC